MYRPVTKSLILSSLFSCSFRQKKKKYLLNKKIKRLGIRLCLYLTTHFLRFSFALVIIYFYHHAFDHVCRCTCDCVIQTCTYVLCSRYPSDHYFVQNVKIFGKHSSSSCIFFGHGISCNSTNKFHLVELALKNHRKIISCLGRYQN